MKAEAIPFPCIHCYAKPTPFVMRNNFLTVSYKSDELKLKKMNLMIRLPVTPLPSPQVFCTCPPGWEGARCETNTDDCVNHVCQNGGICRWNNETTRKKRLFHISHKPKICFRDRTAGYSCSCVSGWRGQYCQEPPLPLPSPRTPFEDHCSLCQVCVTMCAKFTSKIWLLEWL